MSLLKPRARDTRPLDAGLRRCRPLRGRLEIRDGTLGANPASVPFAKAVSRKRAVRRAVPTRKASDSVPGCAVDPFSDRWRRGPDGAARDAEGPLRERPYGRLALWPDLARVRHVLGGVPLLEQLRREVINVRPARQHLR